MGQWAHLYNTTRWRAIRRQQLGNEPLCRMCQKDNKVRLATICDHIQPHRGDELAFYAGPFQSLCASCHSGEKQSLEKGGAARRRISADGWPVDDEPP